MWLFLQCGEAHGECGVRLQPRRLQNQWGSTAGAPWAQKHRLSGLCRVSCVIGRCRWFCGFKSRVLKNRYHKWSETVAVSICNLRPVAFSCSPPRITLITLGQELSQPGDDAFWENFDFGILKQGLMFRGHRFQQASIDFFQEMLLALMWHASCEEGNILVISQHPSPAEVECHPKRDACYLSLPQLCTPAQETPWVSLKTRGQESETCSGHCTKTPVEVQTSVRAGDGSAAQHWAPRNWEVRGKSHRAPPEPGLCSLCFLALWENSLSPNRRGASSVEWAWW